MPASRSTASASPVQVSPLIAAGSQFPVGSTEPEPARDTALSPRERRSFLLRAAVPLRPAAHPQAGSTPKTTTGYDGEPERESEDFNLPDFQP